MSKFKIVRIFVILTSILSGGCYFIKYISASGAAELAEGDPLIWGVFPVWIIKSNLDSWALSIPLCFLPLLLLLLATIFNIVAVSSGKVSQLSNIFTLVSSSIVIIVAVVNRILLSHNDIVSFGFMLWVQVALACICLVLSSYLCHQSRKAVQDKSAPLTSADVAIIGLEGDVWGKIFMLDDDELVSIGRDPQQCNIIVPGSSANVSRKHCVIHYDFDRSAYMVMDTSSNGTFVYENGQKKRLPLGVEVPVSAGNVIMLGDELTTFRLN